MSLGDYRRGLVTLKRRLKTGCYNSYVHCSKEVERRNERKIAWKSTRGAKERTPRTEKGEGVDGGKDRWLTDSLTEWLTDRLID